MIMYVPNGSWHLWMQFCVISKCLHFATFTKKLAKLMCDFVLHSVNVVSWLLLIRLYKPRFSGTGWELAGAKLGVLTTVLEELRCLRDRAGPYRMKPTSS
jgi:hypothetical protein